VISECDMFTCTENDIASYTESNSLLMADANVDRILAV